MAKGAGAARRKVKGLTTFAALTKSKGVRAGLGKRAVTKRTVSGAKRTQGKRSY